MLVTTNFGRTKTKGENGLGQLVEGGSPFFFSGLIIWRRPPQYHIYTCDLQRALFTDMLQSTGSLTVRSALSALTTIVSLVIPYSSQGACFTTFFPPVAGKHNHISVLLQLRF
jgi:hypothetical protein